MLLSVDPDDPVPVHEQVEQQLRLVIASGALAAGSQLPTIRQLASDLGLAKGTVSRAYESLAREDLIEANRRRGTVVARRATVRSSGSVRAVLAGHAMRLALAAAQAGASPELLHSLVDEALERVEAGHPYGAGR